MNHTRFEMLPDGTRVFYYHIGNMPPSEFSTFAQKQIEILNEHFGDKKTIFIPIRGEVCCPPLHNTVDWNKLVSIVCASVMVIAFLVVSYLGSR